MAAPGQFQGGQKAGNRNGGRPGPHGDPVSIGQGHVPHLPVPVAPGMGGGRHAVGPFDQFRSSSCSLQHQEPRAPQGPHQGLGQTGRQGGSHRNVHRIAAGLGQHHAGLDGVGRVSGDGGPGAPRHTCRLRIELIVPWKPGGVTGHSGGHAGSPLR